METNPARQTARRDEGVDRGPDNRRQRQMRYGIGYLIGTLLALWLVQTLVINPSISRAREILHSKFLQQLLVAHRAVLEELATQLLAKEMLDGAVVRRVLIAVSEAAAATSSPIESAGRHAIVTG